MVRFSNDHRIRNLPVADAEGENAGKLILKLIF